MNESIVGILAAGEAAPLALKTAIEEIEGRLIRFGGANDGDKALGGLGVGLVNPHLGARLLPDFVDFGATLADDGANELVRDVKLLGHLLLGGHLICLLTIGSRRGWVGNLIPVRRAIDRRANRLVIRRSGGITT